MTVYTWLILGMWLGLIVYWAVSAGAAKRNLRGAWNWRRQIVLRLGALAMILLALRIPAFRHALRGLRLHAADRGLAPGLVGVLLCALGVGLAVWARIHLGRNWGMPMSRKEDPELVTSGPYAVIRHPIYTGILLAALGTAIGVSPIWLILLVLWGAYFIYSARREEKLMAEQFPDQYPAYVKRTKMLVPFVL